MPHNLNITSANSANSGPNHQAYPPPQPYHINDGLQPEKEPVEFDASHLRGAPAEVEALVHNIKEVAQQFLYHWRTFPIVLPPPLSACTDGEDTLVRKKHHLRDLFIAPSFDELDAVAVDSKGEPRRLTNKQLESIRERGLHKDKYGKPKKLNATQLESIRRCGEFEVDSINFTGQTHRWRLSGLLQRGRDRRRETLLKDLALATRFIVVTARARLVSHCFSISQALKALLTGFLRLLDIIIGVPSLQAQNLDGKIREERCRYLVAELVCRPEYDDSLELLCGFIRKQLRRATMEKFEVERESSQLLPVSVPFVFGTPAGTAVDLRLFSRDIIRKALSTLVSILERETRGWFLHFRERLISELRAQKKSDEEIEQAKSSICTIKQLQVNEAVMREYLQRVYSSILSHPDILALGDGIAQLLIEQAQSVVLMHRAVQNVQRKLQHTKESLRYKMESEHPVLARIGPWMRDRMREAEANFIEECEWSAHEEALSLCNRQNLRQTVYFLNRDLTFMKEREPVLLKELRKVKTPTRSFQWPTQIWLPRNWIVRRNFQGVSEIIPTVLSNTPTSITTPRADPSQPVFLVEREICHTTTTRWPMWRWINYIARTWCWTWNAMFLFGVAVPWCSRVSLRALLLVEPFTPDLEMPIVTLLLHAFMALVMDLDSPEPSRNRYLVVMEALVWNIGIQGCLQPIVALLVAVCICPIISFLILTIAVIRYWIRVMWDTAMFHLVIKNRGRVPASDSFVVKRIAGPGLASDYYYQIRPEQALAAFEAKLELDELLAFQQETERLITQPQRDFTQFVEACFSPFATSLAKTRDPYKSLEKEARDLVAVLHEKLDRRRKDLQTGLGVAVRSKIKLTTFDLKIVIQQAALMLERLYPSHVLARLNGCEEDFWENKGLNVGDWAGLAGLMYADMFSLDFLQPLDDTDTKFKLEPHPGVDLTRYTEMVHSTELGGVNGLDLLGAIYAPRGNIQVQSPYLEVSYFNPRAKQASNSRKPEKRCETSLLTSPRSRRKTNSGLSVSDGRWQPWKREIRPYSAEKLVIPLPIPHPAHIAVNIHNRDSEDPIDLDSELCQNILRAIEESPGEMATECVGRYRGGGGDSSFDSVASQSSVSLETGLDTAEVLQEGEIKSESETYHWTLSNWGGGMARRRNNSGSIKVDLASPEDVTLDTDTTRVMFSTYGTTV
ncbi:Protein of unknown function [Cotesia congregata]|uniref:Uncharacterized protein n=1 Tax=Cotesia congregata TaxID=51543 RepID=A0A8J2MT75_COTCN|nr:Protein of unknown function [Cotesia congregata]